MLHVVGIALSVILYADHEVTVFLTSSQTDGAFRVADGVIEGIVQDAGQQVIVEKAVDVIGLDRTVDSKPLQ